MYSNDFRDSAFRCDHQSISLEAGGRSRFSGFTLIELLIVVAIIGILIGMLLPAVQQVREAARRTTCSNNIAQLGLALHNYEFSRERFPPGVVEKTGPILTEEKGQHIGFLVQILPFLEQQGIYDNINFKLGAYAVANSAARKMEIPTFNCASFPYQTNDTGSAGLTNYAGCNNGVEVQIDADNNGILFLNSEIGFGDIYDGSSNTILLGEFIPASDSLGWVSGTRSSLRNAVELANVSSAGLADYFTGLALQKESVGGFGSMHPGVVNFAMADGSVQPVYRGIDPIVMETLGNRKDGAMMGNWND